MVNDVYKEAKRRMEIAEKNRDDCVIEIDRKIEELRREMKELERKEREKWEEERKRGPLIEKL